MFLLVSGTFARQSGLKSAWGGASQRGGDRGLRLRYLSLTETPHLEWSGRAKVASAGFLAAVRFLP